MESTTFAVPQPPGSPSPASPAGATPEATGPMPPLPDGLETQHETASELTIVVDPHGRLVFANRAFRTALGASKAALQRASLFDLVDPYDHALCQAWLQQSRTTSAPPRVRLLFIGPDGREVPVEGSASPCPGGEASGLVLATLTDLTEQERVASAQRQSVELMQLLSEHAPCGVFVTDPAGRLRYSNRRLRTLADLLHVNEPRGVWWQMVHPADRERVLAQWQGAQQGHREFTAEFRVNSPTPEPRWIRTRIAHSWSSDGRLSFSVGVTEDVTTERQAEHVLRRAQEQLEDLVRSRTEELQQTNRELSDLVYAFSHDLKSPLRGIMRLAEWLGEDFSAKLGPDGCALLEKLQSRVGRLHSLVDGILAYSRVGRGTDPESLVDSGALLTELIRLLDPPPNINVRVPAPLPVVSAVPHQLHQLFVNLIDNAIKFMDKPQGVIEITCRRVGTAWEFAVTDNGPGIPARFHEKIFGLFQRLELQADRPGTGVGLALVKRIVERRGGQIRVESEEGVGTTFRFSWPDRTKLTPV